MKVDKKDVLDIAATLISRGILSKSLHGNVSVRLDDGERLLMTGSSLTGLTEDSLAVLDLDGNVVSGEVAPTEREIIRMHTAVYRERSDVGSIIHTHSPSATTYAVAGKDLPLVAESLARWGVTHPIPVAQWAPRGSDEAVGFILDAVRRGHNPPAVLLQSHGVLAWGAGPNEALRRTIAIEENAQLALGAAALGGALELTPEMAQSAAARKAAYQSA